ncbi:DUF3972 domain-containing protein [Campylobacter sp. MIT 97-5078]|uniref:DUF3972 domain-containing protein n=1 Tax=Campylobacter sp. MIT 97-5078 TaxID=1548153 RepID=UPI0009DDA5F1|nr:DUF3972 domain-containing protein [Campylobacter sp. MIT 97-5078]TQR28296.1 DUF3972 domain-containing protein [Campylobacter sp. MIT 97-5078]
MQTYLELDEFCKLVHLNEDVVKSMMANNTLNFKEEDGKIYIEAHQGTFSVVPSSKDKTSVVSSMSLAGESFVEKTIGTILNLHEKVLDAKDETLDALKGENKFLKDALYSMQELYDEDRKVIDSLNSQLKHTMEELEFMKRKYKLMWNKAVDNFTGTAALKAVENATLNVSASNSTNSDQSIASQNKTNVQPETKGEV